MSRIEEIEKEIEQLTPREFTEIARWVLELDQKRWDDQMDRDAALASSTSFARKRRPGKMGFRKIGLDIAGFRAVLEAIRGTAC